MKDSMLLRIAVKEKSPGQTTIPLGRYAVEHRSLCDADQTQYDNMSQRILPLIENNPNFGIIDPHFHKDAIVDIFASELATGMRNNIADYTWNELLPFTFDLPILPPVSSRSLPEIKEYIQQFRDSSQLLKHLFAKELSLHSFSSSDEDEEGSNEWFHLTLYENFDSPRRVTAEEVVACMLDRADKPPSDNTLEKIVDLEFT